MKCQSCETILESDWLFCPQCGETLVADSDSTEGTTASDDSLQELRHLISTDAAVYRNHADSDEDIDALIRSTDPARCGDWQRAAQLGWPEAQWLLSRRLVLSGVYPEDHGESLRLCELAAGQGEPLALHDLAARYEAGFGVEQDTAQAALLYRQAAGTGLARAQYRLAECYLRFGGGAWEIGEAVKWLYAAAEQDLPAAKERLAEVYVAFGPAAMPPLEGVTWLQRAAEQGNPDAQRKLAQCHADGEGVAQDTALALRCYASAATAYAQRPNARPEVARCFKAMAELGDAETCSVLAECFATGDGLPQDLREAVRWHEKAVEGGHLPARLKLMEAYLELAEHLSTGEGGAGLQEAYGFFRKAADMDCAKACLQVAECHASGKGVSKDMVEAVAWYRNAADLGESLAQFRLGLCYANGDTVDRDDQEAIRWYRRAADAGLAPAQFKLGMHYSTGDKQQKDPACAAEYFARAAEQGYVRAQCKLGECYLAGQGVAKNWEAAMKWLSKAANAGDDHAQALLRRHGVRR